MHMLRTIALAVLTLTAAAASASEEVLLLRSQESPEVPALCAAGENIKLGAFLYAPRTRARDGLVMKEGSRPIGTAVGCGTMPLVVKKGTTATFRLAIDLGDRTVSASGECTVAEMFAPLAMPPYPVLLAGCALAVEPGSDPGLLHGMASSSSVFLPRPIPGYDTGSYWTFHLYYAD